MSKSGTLTYEAADQVVKAGLGITTAIGIGATPSSAPPRWRPFSSSPTTGHRRPS